MKRPDGIRPGRRVAAISIMIVAPWLAPRPGTAAVLTANPGQAAARIASAAPGDTILLARGVHPGPLTLHRPVVLRGEAGSIVHGGGRGSVIRIRAGSTTIESLDIRAGGTSVMAIDAAVLILDSPDVTIRSLRTSDVLYGVVAERSPRLRIESCRLEGRAGSRTDRTPTAMDAPGGNGVHLWYTDDAIVERCRISGFLDGIYLSFANRTLVRESHLVQNLRYGLHTMYCHQGHLLGNRFEHNVAGSAIMFANGLEIIGNDFIHNRGPRTYGLLLKDCSAGVFGRNRVIDNTIAIFLDNSNRNRFRGNLIQDNGWGVIIFSSCAGNEFARNNFLNNDYPVALDMRRSDNRFDDGAVGNYWSENEPYDLDADGISDVPFSPVGAFAFLSKQFPDLSILAQSPAVAALGVAERTIPALRPSEVVDRYPLVTPATDARPVDAAWHAERGPRTRLAPVALAAYLALAGMGAGGMLWGKLRA